MAESCHALLLVSRNAYAIANLITSTMVASSVAVGIDQSENILSTDDFDWSIPTAIEPATRKL